MKGRYLFKAKRIDNGEWVTGHYVKGLDIYAKEVHLIFEPTTIFYSSGETDGWSEVDPSTICQCTGLKDKNGKLIWENDIVKGHRINFGSHRHIGKVKYINGRYEIIGVKQYAGFSDALSLSYEVLGNIFDNPELLESEEN